MMRKSLMTAFLVMVLGAGSGVVINEVLAPASAVAGDEDGDGRDDDDKDKDKDKDKYDESVFAAQGICAGTDKHGKFSKDVEYSVKDGVEAKGDTDRFFCGLTRMSPDEDDDLEKVEVRLSNEKNKHKEIKCCVYSISPTGKNQDVECKETDKKDENPILKFKLKHFKEGDEWSYLVTCDVEEGQGVRSIYTKEEAEHDRKHDHGHDMY